MPSENHATYGLTQSLRSGEVWLATALVLIALTTINASIYQFMSIDDVHHALPGDDWYDALKRASLVRLRYWTVPVLWLVDKLGLNYIQAGNALLLATHACLALLAITLIRRVMPGRRASLFVISLVVLMVFYPYVVLQLQFKIAERIQFMVFLGGLLFLYLADLKRGLLRFCALCLVAWSMVGSHAAGLYVASSIALALAIADSRNLDPHRFLRRFAWLFAPVLAAVALHWLSGQILSTQINLKDYLDPVDPGIYFAKLGDHFERASGALWSGRNLSPQWVKLLVWAAAAAAVLASGWLAATHRRIGAYGLIAFVCLGLIACSTLHLPALPYDYARFPLRSYFWFPFVLVPLFALTWQADPVGSRRAPIFLLIGMLLIAPAIHAVLFTSQINHGLQQLRESDYRIADQIIERVRAADPSGATPLAIVTRRRSIRNMHRSIVGSTRTYFFQDWSKWAFLSYRYNHKFARASTGQMRKAELICNRSKWRALDTPIVEPQAAYIVVCI